MESNPLPPPPEPATPPSSPMTPAITQQPCRSRKKLFIAAALIAIIAVAALAFVLASNPNLFLASGEPVPLQLNYSVGEKMTYSLTMTMSLMGQTETVTGTSTMEVTNIEGDVYTIQSSMSGLSSGSITGQNISYTMKMDKTGRIVDFGNLPESAQSVYDAFSFVPGYGASFGKVEVRLGESWQIPLNAEMGGVSMQGTANYKVTELKALTVPAGTYNVYKLEISANDIRVEANAPQTTGVSIGANMNGYVYSEKGTSQMVQMHMEESISGPVSSGISMNMAISMHMTLTEHIR
jgi:hypothetical protein